MKRCPTCNEPLVVPYPGLEVPCANCGKEHQFFHVVIQGGVETVWWFQRTESAAGNMMWSVDADSGPAGTGWEPWFTDDPACEKEKIQR